MIEAIKVTRRLDKGRLILPGDFREAAGFTPDQEVSVALADFEGKKVFIISKKEGTHALIDTGRNKRGPEEKAD